MADAEYLIVDIGNEEIIDRLAGFTTREQAIADLRDAVSDYPDKELRLFIEVITD